MVSAISLDFQLFYFLFRTIPEYTWSRNILNGKSGIWIQLENRKFINWFYNLFSMHIASKGMIWTNQKCCSWEKKYFDIRKLSCWKTEMSDNWRLLSLILRYFVVFNNYYKNYIQIHIGRILVLVGSWYSTLV